MELYVFDRIGDYFFGCFLDGFFVRSNLYRYFWGFSLIYFLSFAHFSLTRGSEYNFRPIGKLLNWQGSNLHRNSNGFLGIRWSMAVSISYWGKPILDRRNVTFFWNQMVQWMIYWTTQGVKTLKGLQFCFLWVYQRPCGWNKSLANQLGIIVVTMKEPALEFEIEFINRNLWDVLNFFCINN